jgi:hypothetical protein
MRAAYGGLLAPLGTLTRLELLSEGTVADDRTRLYRATYGDTRVSVSVRIGPGGGFTGWQLTPLARSP